MAIPDFEAGAMENWGLLTFREETLLYDNNTSSVADRKLITKIIAHELAHQVLTSAFTSHVLSISCLRVSEYMYTLLIIPSSFSIAFFNNQKMLF